MGNRFENKISNASTHEVDAPSVRDMWARKRSLINMQDISQLGAEVRDLKEIFQAYSEEKRNFDEWQRVYTIGTTHTLSAHAHLDTIEHSIDIPTNIIETFNKLEEDFDSQSRRIAWCDKLEKYLLSFEDQLEAYNYKYLYRIISTLRDVFAFNYVEQLTHEQLCVLKEVINVIYEISIEFDKDTFEKYYSALDNSGLSLLPTTQKAIEKFGE